MTALSETQHRVLASLRQGPGGHDALPLLRRSRGPTPAQRLQVYRNNLFEGLTDALAAVFPVLAQLIGEDCFRQVARRHISTHPLCAANLHGFGRELPAQLAEEPSTATLPYLADVAALEWAWHEVYHEAACTPLQAARLGEVPAAQQMDLRLQLAPAARLVSSPFPVLRIWRAHQGEIDPALRISLDEGGVRLLLLRRALEIEFVLLGAAEEGWLRALTSGASLAEATLAGFTRDTGFDLAAALGRHLSLGTFAALSFAMQPTIGRGAGSAEAGP